MRSLIDHKHELLLEHAGLAPDVDEHGAVLIMALLRTTALIDRACAAELAAFNLTEGRLSVLLAVSARASVPGEGDSRATPARIADELGVSRAAVTGLIDGLERQGLIERHASDTDRRSTTVALTQAGRDALDAIGPRYGAWLRDLAASVSPDATLGTIAALSALQSKLGDGASNE